MATEYTTEQILSAIDRAKADGNINAVNQLTNLLQQTQGIKSLEPDANVGNFFESLVGGTKRLFSSAGTGVEAPFTSGEEAAISGLQREQGFTERPGASLEAVKKTYEQEGVIGATGEVISQVPTALAEQTPVLASIYAGFKAGASLPLPPQLKVAAGLIGSLIVPFLSMSGNNMQRKAEEDIKAGREVDVNELKAYGTGLVQAGIERVGLGLSGVTKAMGMSIPQLIKQGGTKATEKLAKESLAKTIGMGAGKLAVAEGATEVTQQMLERYYAGLPLTDEEAKKEYIEAAYAAALLGPTVGIGSRVKSKGAAQEQFIINEAKKQEREQKKQALLEKDERDSDRDRVDPDRQPIEIGEDTQEGVDVGTQENVDKNVDIDTSQYDGSESYDDLKKKNIVPPTRVEQTDTVDNSTLNILKLINNKGQPFKAGANLQELGNLDTVEKIELAENILEGAKGLKTSDTDAINDFQEKLASKKQTMLDTQQLDTQQDVVEDTAQEEKIKTETDVVPDPREQQILDFVKTEDGTTASAIQKKFKIGFNKAKNIMNKAVNEGLITTETKGKSIVYKKALAPKSERVDTIKAAAEKIASNEIVADESILSEIDRKANKNQIKGKIKSQKAKASNPELKGKKIKVAQLDPNTKQVIPKEGIYVFRNGVPFLETRDKVFKRKGTGKNQKIVAESSPGSIILTRIDEGALINPTDAQLTALTKKGATQEKKIVKAEQKQVANTKAQLENDIKQIQLIEAGEMDAGFDPDSVLLEEARPFTPEKRYNKILRNYKAGLYNDFINKKENKRLKTYIKTLFSRKPGTEKDKEVIKGLKDKNTLGQVLTTLNTKFVKSLNDAQKSLVPILLGTPNVGKTKFKFNPGMENENGAYGTYTVKDDLIQLSDKGDIETVLHEGTHAATTNSLKKHITKKGRGKTSIGRRLVELFDDTKRADTDNKFTNELENIDEFVTNALNNGEFQEFLASISATPTNFKAPPAPPSGQDAINDEYSYYMDLKRKGATNQEINGLIIGMRRRNEASGASVWSKFVKVVQDMIGANAVPDNVLNDVLAITPSLFLGPNTEQQASSDQVLSQKTEQELKDEIDSTKTPAEIQKGKQSGDKPTSNKPKYFWDRLFTAVFSFDAGLNNAVKREMRKLKMDWDVISKTLNRMSVSQALHAETIAQQFLKFGKIKYYPETGQFEIEDDPNSPSFDKLMARMDELSAKYGISKKTFRQMVHKNFVARRAQSLRQYNADLLTQAQALEAQGKPKEAKDLYDNNKIIVDLSQEQINTALDFEKDFPEINELHDTWIQTKNNLIEFLVTSELMTEAQANEFMAVVDVVGAPKELAGEEGGGQTFVDTYVPFFREDTDKKPKDFKQLRLGDRGQFKALKGSYEPVADVFDNMQLWMRDSVKRGIMNRKGIDKINAIEALPEEVQETMVEIADRGGNPNTISMSRVIDGKRQVVHYKFSDPMYAQAFSGMDQATLSGLGFFAQFSNFLRTNVVLYPLFSIAQLPQDSVSAMFSSGVRNPFMIPLRVLSEFPLTLLDKSKSHKRLQRLGATGGRAYLQNETQADLDINQPGFYNATRRTMGKIPGLTPQSAIKLGDKELSVTGFLNRLAMASDNAVRQAVFQQTLAETKSKANPDGDVNLAMNRAFEIINFKRAGANSAITGLRQVVPFFGAFLQAASVQGRTITGAGVTPQARAKGVQQFLMTGAQLSALTLLYSAFAADDEEYEKLDPTIRDRRFLLGDGAHISLRPDLFTYMFKIVPEHVLQNMLYESEDNRKTWDSLKIALKEVGMFNVLPQAIRPAISLMTNYDPLTGRAITPQSIEDRVPERQITAGTSELAKLLSLKANEGGKAIGIDSEITPIEVDYFLRQYFGYTGGLITMMTSSMIDEYDVFDYDRPTKSERDLLASIPGMSAFISREYGNRHTTDYYQLRGEVDKTVKAFKDLQKYGYSNEKTQEFLKENFDEITIQPLINDLQSQLSIIRAERSKVLAMPRTMISPDGRKEVLDRLYKLEKSFLDRILSVRKSIYGTGFKSPD